MGNWKSKAEQTAYNLAYYKRNEARLKEYAKAYYHAKKAGTFVPTIPESAGMTKEEANRLWDRRSKKKLRTKVIETLGGPRCKRCGFDDERALQIDHVHGGGVEERRRIGWRAVYERALKYPAEYQVLCANCNWIKRAERGETRSVQQG